MANTSGHQTQLRARLATFVQKGPSTPFCVQVDFIRTSLDSGHVKCVCNVPLNVSDPESCTLPVLLTKNFIVWQLCPGGYYCDNSNGVVNITDAVKCPAGYFCPPGDIISSSLYFCFSRVFCSHLTILIVSGTARADEWPCPLGTFGNGTGYNSSFDCSACLGGHYCGIVGQTHPTGPCTAGYFCRRFANMSTPNQGYDADICPQGKKSLSGKFLGKKTDDAHGVFDVKKRHLLTPFLFVFLSGFYCPEGTVEPYGCPPGSFGASDGRTNSSECSPCHPGKFCEHYGNIDDEGMKLVIHFSSSASLWEVLTVQPEFQFLCCDHAA